MSDNTIKISGDLNWSFDRMAAQLPEIQNQAVRAGGMMLKEEIKKTLTSKMPSSTNPVREQTGRGGYKITSQEPLVEGIRQTKTEDGRVKVHALGSGAPGSSTFITRFYEEVTKPRYNKNFKGKRLKKKRFTGAVGGLHFFQDTVNAYINKVTEHISNIISNRLEITFNERQ